MIAHDYPGPIPAERMDELAAFLGIDSDWWPDSDLARLAGHDSLGWWIGQLRDAEASIRRFGNG